MRIWRRLVVIGCRLLLIACRIRLAPPIDKRERGGERGEYERCGSCVMREAVGDGGLLACGVLRRDVMWSLECAGMAEAGCLVPSRAGVFG